MARRSVRLPRTPRPLTHRSPRWRMLAVATTLATTVAVGAAAAYAGTPVPGDGTPAAGTAGPSAAGDPPGPAVCAAAPDAFNLASAFGQAVRTFIAEQSPKYRNRYYGLDYGFSITDEKVTGSTGAVTASYHGSAYRATSGERVTRAGTARASFRWSGCAWQTVRFSY